MRYSALDDFAGRLRQGAQLCIMPVPRLVLANKIDSIEGFVFYPASTLDLSELRVVWVPADELGRMMPVDGQAVGYEGDDLGWLECAATGVSIEDIEQHALIAFTTFIDWELFLSGDHRFHCDLIREMSERGEMAMDLLRFDFCRLHLADTLPGRVGTLDAGSPFSAAVFYAIADHEAYVIAGQVVTHLLVAGLGLEVDDSPSTTCIGSGETGNIARRALTLYSEAMEANSLTAKFIRCMSLMEFLTFPDDYQSMKKVKREIAAHIAETADEYKEILNDFERLTSFRDAHGRQNGLRTSIIHQGARFEAMVSGINEQDAIFRRLEKYIGKTLFDLIELSDQPWSDVVSYRHNRKQAAHRAADR